MRGAADEIANLAASIREEVPDTFAAVRVSGMELTDCLEEVGELTADVGAGVKGTGRAVAASVDTAGAVGRAAGTVKRVVPEVRARAAPVVKRALERSEKSIEETLRTNAEAEEYSSRLWRRRRGGGSVKCGRHPRRGRRQDGGTGV